KLTYRRLRRIFIKAGAVTITQDFFYLRQGVFPVKHPIPAFDSPRCWASTYIGSAVNGYSDCKFQ
ncbi:hypothetical protein MKW98_011217, partial [Papaver atlanticum]